MFEYIVRNGVYSNIYKLNILFLNVFREHAFEDGM